MKSLSLDRWLLSKNRIPDLANMKQGPKQSTATFGLKERDYLLDPSVDGVVLKWVLDK